ncbi:hypothetical protein D3C83_15880 [compost metagenome]
MLVLDAEIDACRGDCAIEGLSDALEFLGFQVFRARQHRVDQLPPVLRPDIAVGAGMDEFGNGVVADRQEQKCVRSVGPAQQHVIAQVPDREQLFVEPGQFLANFRRQIKGSAFGRKCSDPGSACHDGWAASR